jgi:hypothetical protein
VLTDVTLPPADRRRIAKDLAYTIGVTTHKALYEELLKGISKKLGLAAGKLREDEGEPVEPGGPMPLRRTRSLRKGGRPRPVEAPVEEISAPASAVVETPPEGEKH